MSNYRFRINPSTDNIEAKPSNKITVTRKKEMTDAGGWYYVSSINDIDIHSRNSIEAYNYLLALITSEISDETGVCGDHELIIEMKQGYGWVVKFTATFSIYDMKVDLDRCTITIKVEENSIVKCFTKHLDEEFNLLSLTESQESNLAPADAVESIGYEWTFEPSGGTTTEPHPGTPAGVYWVMDTELFESYSSGTDYTLYLWYFQFKITDCLGGVPIEPDSSGTWFNFTFQQTGSECTADGTTEWRKIFASDPLAVGLAEIVSDFNPSLVSQVYANSITSGLVTGPPSNYSAIINWGSISSLPSIPNGRTLLNVKNYIRSLCSSLNDYNQNDWIRGGISYVTNEENVYPNMIIHQITDVKYPTAFQTATKAVTTPKKILSDINKMFDVWWRPLEDGTFVWEHRSYFQALSPTVNDFTTVTGHKFFNYLKSNFNGIINYTSRAQLLKDFVGKPITYTQPCVNSEAQNINLEVFATDVKYIQSSPDETPNDCLVLLALNDAGVVALNNGKITEAPVSNAPLSWANLHHYFHRHKGYTRGGTINGQSGLSGEPTFIRTVPLRESRITVLDCGLSIDPYAPIKTELTESLGIESGEIEELKVDLSTNVAEITYSF